MLKESEKQRTLVCRSLFAGCAVVVAGSLGAAGGVASAEPSVRIDIAE